MLLAALRRLNPLRRCPADCGSPEPSGGYTGRSYVRDLSPDQARIAEALPALLGPRTRLLHVGVGASALAARFAGEVAAIDGVTVLDDEQAAAEALGIANYRVWKLDKHGAALAALPGGYDVIVDNNPGSFTCCARHFRVTTGTYARLLAPGGCVVTEARGAGWRQHRGIALGWRAWCREGRRVGLAPDRLTDTVWLWRAPGGA